MITLAAFESRHLSKTLRWINDPEVAIPFAFRRKVDSISHERWFQQIQKDQTQAVFAIEDSELGHIGNIGLKNIDPAQRSALMWMYIGRGDARGGGRGQCALRLLQKEAFVRMGLTSLDADVLPENQRAIHIYQKCGFIRELHGNGMLRLRCLKEDIELAESPAVVLMQPTFLSWPGFFELLDIADIFVFLDDFQLSRQSWSQRNRMFVCPGKTGLVSLPLGRHGGGNFLEVTPAINAHWKKNSSPASVQHTQRRRILMPLSSLWRNGFTENTPILRKC